MALVKFIGQHAQVDFDVTAKDKNVISIKIVLYYLLALSLVAVYILEV